MNLPLMKIILSRKGFDSDCGGYPSPILPDGRLISLPIPSDRQHSNALHYSDLRLDEGLSYLKLIQQLQIFPKLETRLEKIQLGQNAECHLDPDIYSNIIERVDSWRPLFGQIDAAQSHLSKEHVQPDDIFLFFGWFKKVIKTPNGYSYDQSERSKHVIFGYMQIGEIWGVRPETNLFHWMLYHPHASSRVKNNTLYLSRDTLTWDNELPGAGVFSLNQNLVLTKEGMSRSKWCLPGCFENVRISYHSKESWQCDYFQSVARGQEFVVEENPKVEEWARGLIQSSSLQNLQS
jgi:hypothetical protein